MSRCDYDGVFYRVFCVTLLATAFTFTVILTNVFIDIDGLLSKKAKQNQDRKENSDYTENGVNNEVTNLPYNPTGENIYEKNYIDDQPETSYRTKRSLDFSNSPSYINNYDVITILTNQLTKLLQQSDELLDYGLTENYNKVNTVDNLDYDKAPLKENYSKDKRMDDLNEISKNRKDYNNHLHRAVHKILLNGIAEHKDISDVYKTVNKILKNFNNKKTSQITDEELHKETKNHIKVLKGVNEKQGTLNNWQIASDDQIQFLNELIKCENLHKEIMRRTKKFHVTPTAQTTATSPLEDPELLIKTFIEIIPLELNKIANEKFRNAQEKSNSTLGTTDKPPHGNKSNNHFYNIRQNPNTTFEFKLLKQVLNNELNSYKITDVVPKPDDKLIFLRKTLKQLEKHSFHNRKPFEKLIDRIDKDYIKRSKRQVRVKYEDYDSTTPKIKPVRKGNRKTDDELYVEIETHFDGTGVRGEKKKKLVKNLIDRIQKAIRSDISHDNNKKKQRQHMHIKKRVQNPIKHKNAKYSNNYMFKMQSVEHRQLNPINKILPENDVQQEKDVERIENWEQPYFNPNSFTMPNIEDSEEISNPPLDFNNVLSSGIPQRVQVPLNTRTVNVNNEKSQNTNSDKGNVTLFIKDIDGSGFSVGFNQYVDEPPDVDSMKLFSGLENLIETYHENYDQNNNENTNLNELDESIEKQHELMKRDADLGRNEHILLRRSVQELNNEDYHSNAYKVIFDKKILPYENYEEILQRPLQKSLTSDYEYKIRNYNYNPKNIKIFTKDIKIKALPVILDNDILEKKLKPSEIFSLASLLLNNVKNRKKRSLNVKRITNLKSRMKINRYINTNDMQSRSIFLKHKRNKREVNKIRIIASDNLHDMPKNSEENIFLVSGENLFTNRAVLREIELPESDTGDEAVEDHYDGTMPYGYEEPNSETSYVTNIFDAKYRHNALMSKYPHLFTSSVTESKELHFGNNNDYAPGRSDKQKYKLENLLDMHVTENNASAEKNSHVPDIVNAIMPSPTKSNYKVTVKISPKNLTNAPSGFKEMHTVINKTYNNNGVQYYSLVNVSEISKIEKINKTKEILEHSDKKPTTLNPISEQKNNIKLLLALQKQKIEQQLQNLNKQKENLETILQERDGIKERNVNDLLKEFMHADIHKPGDDLALLHEPYTSYVLNHNPVTIEHSTATTSLATEKPEPKTTLKELNNDVDKNKVNTSIKENEHLTNEILSKINKNTDILQCFLKKLSDKFDQQLSVRTSSTTHHSPTVEHITEAAKHLRERVEMPKDWGLNLHHLHDSFFNDHMPSKNDSHYAIPFVYAYQHPYLPQSKQPIPMAKIVYHGHIHTNALHKHPNDSRNYNANNGDNSKHHHTSTGTVNHDSSKFFIDTLARDGVGIPPTHVQKPDVHISPNATKMY